MGAIGGVAVSYERGTPVQVSQRPSPSSPSSPLAPPSEERVDRPVFGFGFWALVFGFWFLGLGLGLADLPLEARKVSIYQSSCRLLMNLLNTSAFETLSV